jgi:hypothetical protein
MTARGATLVVSAAVDVDVIKPVIVAVHLHRNDTLIGDLTR